jgi:RNA recognition motif-containing protein
MSSILIVDNLPVFSREEDLRSFITNAGCFTEEVKLNINHDVELERTYGVIIFPNETSAKDALDRFQGAKFYGRKPR